MFLLLFVFGYQNIAETVEIQFLNWQTENAVPLPLVLLISFFLGGIFVLLFAVKREFKLMREIRRVKKKNEELATELRDIRNLPLEHDISRDAT